MLKQYLERLQAGLDEMRKEEVRHLAVSDESVMSLERVLRGRFPALASSASSALPTPSQSRATVVSPATPPASADFSRIRAEFDSGQPVTSGNRATPSESSPGAFSAVASPAKPAPPPPLPPPPAISIPEDGTKEARLAQLRDLVLADPVCLSQKKPDKKLVFGIGDPDAQLLFCGEAPGADEEEQGEPFVGPAGQLLTKIIGAMGLGRAQVYIANVMKWRPPTGNDYGNRPPTPEEMAYCLPYLRAQLDIIRPRAIVALGGTAIAGLLGLPPTEVKVGNYRGRWQDFHSTPLMPTYHPSYLLRNEGASRHNKTKRTVWEDMLLVMEKLSLPITPRQRAYFLPPAAPAGN